MFILTTIKENKETRLKFSHGSVILLQKMVNYQEVRVRQTNILLNKLKSAAKNFEDEELPHELFLTGHKIEVSDVIANNMSTDTKLSTYQISNFLKDAQQYCK